MTQSVNKDWLIRILVIDVVVCIAIYIFNASLTLSILVFIGILIIALYFLYSVKCPHCGNLGALQKTDTRKIHSDQRKRFFTREEEVGGTVHIDRYGDTIGRSHDYVIQRYVEIVTVGTYEDRFVCKYCGFVTIKKYHREDHREVFPVN